MVSRPILISLLFATAAVAQDDGLRRADVAFFEQNIRPVLAAQCVKCHGVGKQEGGLRLDSRQAMLKGGESGPAVVPRDPANSLLLQAIRYEELEMPPSGQLTARDIARFRHWIASGAVWPESSSIREEARGITQDDRNWWAFRPLSKPPVPKVRLQEWIANDIDRFVLAALEEKGMQPAPVGDKARLVRRLYFDVIGLPPTPEEIDAFVENDKPTAWEELVDKLLASKHHGEHWARHWLDVVRYAESDGWNQDAYRPNIWRYRDYVVNSFNSDKPWADFVREQLAGDEIPADNPEYLAATGFLRLGIYEYNQRDARGQWNDIMNEMTDVAGDVFLGVGMACARCHDHKFDPILQRDYFALRAFFEPIEWRDDLVYATDEEKQKHALKKKAWENEAAEVLAQIDALVKPYHDKKWKSTVDKFPLDIQACFNKPVEKRTSWEHQMAYLVSRQFEEEAGGPLKSMSKADKAKHAELKKELARFDKTKPKPLPKVMAASDFAGTSATTFIQDTTEPVEPAFLSVLTGESSSTVSRVSDPDQRADAAGDSGATVNGPYAVGSPRFDADDAVVNGAKPGDSTRRRGRRTRLAEWIARKDNPLTNRVIVNRIWQYHFGHGLVSTPNDFGKQGQRPTHPALLDWLTAEFVEDDGSFKRLHKQILMSATWRQSVSNPLAEEHSKMDPQEALLWRSRVRRLSAEQIRDAMLVISGELKAQVGGPSVALSAPRRSLYIKSFRNKPDAFLHQFDMANGLKSVADRNSTTTPTQALMMINGPYPLARARAMAKRLTATKFETIDELLSSAFRWATGRLPTTEENHRAAGFVGGMLSDSAGRIDQAKLADYCHILFNSNEFLYVD